MKNRTLFRLAVTLLLTWPMLVWAATPASSPEASLPTQLQTLGQRLGIKVVRAFKTDVPGVSGYIVQSYGGRLSVIYTYKGFLFSGVMLNAAGKDLTAQYAKQYYPKPPYAAVAKALSASKYLVSEGRIGAPEIYVFADPNCFYCRKFWKLTRDWVAQGKIRIHWALVGFLKRSSAGRAAAILAAKDRAGALTEDEAHFDFPHEEGAIAQLQPIPKKYRQVLARHQADMQKLRFQGTPGIVFKDVQGHWHGYPGVPQMDSFAKILGISN